MFVGAISKPPKKLTTSPHRYGQKQVHCLFIKTSLCVHFVDTENNVNKFILPMNGEVTDIKVWIKVACCATPGPQNGVAR